MREEIERLIAGYINGAAPEHARAIARRYSVLPTSLTMGGGLGIRPDGVVVAWDYDDEAAPHVEESIRWRRIAIFTGIAKFPSLALLRLARPAEAVDCPSCDGDGVVTLPDGPTHKNIRCICAGAGWVVPGEE